MPELPNFNSYPHGLTPRSFASNVSRTDTTARQMFTIPAGSYIKSIAIIGPKSNAGTSARISIGSNGGTGKEFLADFNVKGNGNVSYPSSFSHDAAANDPNPVGVTVTYAEDGSASSSGGPWLIVMDLL